MPPLRAQVQLASVRVGQLKTEGWHAVGIAFATILPWAIVAVFDAIDSRYRRLRVVALRLLLSTCCNAIAYVFGALFVIELVHDANRKRDYDRFDEVATFLVLLLFNVWFLLRNIRGWIQFAALYRLRPLFEKMQNGFAEACTPPHPPATRVIRAPTDTRPFTTVEDMPHEPQTLCIDGIALMNVSDRLINNDLDTPTPLLNPIYPRGHHWQLAAWRAWWTQHCPKAQTLDAGPAYDVTVCAVRAQDLPEEGPRWPVDEKELVHHPLDNGVIPRGDVHAWKQALVRYGTEAGQQDTRGPPNLNLFSAHDRSGVATLVHEKTMYPPHRMSSLWYSTARFEELYAGLAEEINVRHNKMMMPATFAMWKEITTDIAQRLEEPMYLSGEGLCIYAGELASASILLSNYSWEYRSLVERVYQDGRSARWTFGWSGLLSCFSNLWTRHRVFVAMLNGLSLLAIKSANTVAEIEPCVRAMMVGYASFAVSDRAVGKRIAQARKAELLVRYRKNRGKTCRGSGLCATRMACRILKIPAEASHMDGLPAFSTGWAMEYMAAQPGSQKPEHGGSHNEIEEQEGSSNAWRYPDSHV